MLKKCNQPFLRIFLPLYYYLFGLSGSLDTCFKSSQPLQPTRMPLGIDLLKIEKESLSNLEVKFRKYDKIYSKVAFHLSDLADPTSQFINRTQEFSELVLTGMVLLIQYNYNNTIIYLTW